MSKEIIKVDNLSYSIFDNFNISFNKDEFTTISGSNKCGKTLLLRILSKNISEINNVLIDKKDINEYSYNELYNLLGYISKETLHYNYDTVINELKSVTSISINNLVDKYNLSDIKNKDIKDLTIKESIYLTLIINIIKNKEILLIDNIDIYYTKEEILNIIDILTKYNKTIIMTISNLEYSVYSSYLYIMKQGKIILSGTPHYVLQNDNIINKVGLELPFMYDLSVKLKDYNLLNEIETNMDRMIDILWK